MTDQRHDLLSVEIATAVEQVLQRWPEATQPARAGRPAAAPDSAEAERRARVARDVYRARRDRDAAFEGLGAPLGEPGWDILLDLYIAHQERRRVAISSACIASSAPLTTGLRYLETLQRCRLVERCDDPRDKRRSFVLLSGLGIAVMDMWIGRLMGRPAGA